MRRTSGWVCAAAALLLATGPAQAAHRRGWDRASSLGRDVLVATALGMPAIRGDWHGDVQAGAGIGTALVATEALKLTFPERRPDGSDRRSFPSGHTATAFAAAATLQNRYGWQVGVPMQLLAGFVGLSRVEARKHHWYDVAVGAAIGEAAGFALTSRHDDRVRVVPWGDAKGAGMAMALRF